MTIVLSVLTNHQITAVILSPHTAIDKLTLGLIIKYHLIHCEHIVLMETMLSVMSIKVYKITLFSILLFPMMCCFGDKLSKDPIN